MAMMQDLSATNGMTLDGVVNSQSKMRDVTPRHLTRPEKAAVIVRLLVGRGVDLKVNRLSSDHQRRLAHSLSKLSMIDRKTLMDVVHDFTEQVDSLALSFPDGLSEALTLMEPFLSEAPLQALKSELIDRGDPWARVARYDVDRLRPLMDSESAEVCAVLLSKMSVGKASTLLSDMAPERAEILAHAIALTEKVSPDLVDRIGTHVADLLDAEPQSAFGKPAADRVGAILNTTAKAARDTVLSGLETRNAAFASVVKRAIFSFGHIPTRVQPADVPVITREIEPETFTTALAAAMAEEPLAVEFILENMSKRLAEQVRDDAEARGTPKPDEGNAAMSAVVAAIRTLEEAGSIVLLTPED